MILQKSCFLNDTAITMPRIDHAIQVYKRSGEYTPPRSFNILRYYRSAVIGATAGTAMVISAGFSKEGYHVLGYFRKEEDAVTSQVSVEQNTEETVLPLMTLGPR